MNPNLPIDKQNIDDISISREKLSVNPCPKCGSRLFYSTERLLAPGNDILQMHYDCDNLDCDYEADLSEE